MSVSPLSTIIRSGCLTESVPAAAITASGCLAGSGPATAGDQLAGPPLTVAKLPGEQGSDPTAASGPDPAGLAIGVFDSGLGGLTVLHAIMQLLPNEHTVYFGDTGRTPYGNKSPATIIRFSRQNTRFLLEQGIKMVVIACNTASAHAYQAVCDQVDLPVVEVVTPGAEAAAQATRNMRVGIIGTKGTVNSGVYVRALQAATARVVADRMELADPPVAEEETVIIQQACPLFVGLAEEGWWDNEIALSIAREYLQPLKDAGIDTLVLGCTHYPLLMPVIAQVMGPEVALINAGSKVAARVQAVLAERGLLNQSGQPARHTYFTSDSPEQFQELGSSFLDQPVQTAGCINIERY